MLIRDATEDDWARIWPFLREICAAGETFSYPVDLPEERAREFWMLAAPNRTVVAVGDDGTVLGTAKMNANQMGNAAHIASASYMVDPAHSGRGVGRALVNETLAWADQQGFRGMQFNAVVATNTNAVALYESVGFRVAGTIPGGFRHPAKGYVDLLIMFRPIGADAGA
jgi:L-amino acid N-acyltransferase YncA